MNDLFKKRLNMLREERELKQSDLAKMLGITRAAYGYYESGKNTPPPDKLQKLADYFDVSVDYLMGNTNFRNEASRPNSLSEVDVLDVSKTMRSMLDELNNNRKKMTVDGEPLNDETRELLRTSIENSLKIAKILNAKGKNF